MKTLIYLLLSFLIISCRKEYNTKCEAVLYYENGERAVLKCEGKHKHGANNNSLFLDKGCITVTWNQNQLACFVRSFDIIECKTEEIK